MAKKAHKKKRRAVPKKKKKKKRKPTASRRSRQASPSGGRSAAASEKRARARASAAKRGVPASEAAALKRKSALVAWVRGEKVTTHDTRLVLDYLRPLLKRVPQKLVCELLGTSRQALSKWTAEGGPRNGDGTYNLAELLSWLYKRWVKASRKGGDVPGQLPLEVNWEERLKKAKALAAERDYSLSQGRLVSRDLVERLFSELADVLVLALTRLPDLAGDLAGASQTKVRAGLVAFRDRARGELSEMAARCGEGLEEPSSPTSQKGAST